MRSTLGTRTRLVWLLSLVVTAVLSAGLVGPGAGAAFSDRVTVTHAITTGHMKIRIVGVDSIDVDPPTDSYRLTDVVRGSKVQLTRTLVLRNDGAVPVRSLVVSTQSSLGDVPTLSDDLTVRIVLTDDGGTTSQSRTLAAWQSKTWALELTRPMEPGTRVAVALQVSGVLTGHEKDGGVEPVYTFTALDSSA